MMHTPFTFSAEVKSDLSSQSDVRFLVVTLSRIMSGAFIYLLTLRVVTRQPFTAENISAAFLICACIGGGKQP